MNRRGFFGSLAAAATAPVLAAVKDATPAITRSDKGVPRAVDCRVHHPVYVPVIVKRFGVSIGPVVAYDLNADTAVVYRCHPNGNIVVINNDLEYETLRGGVSVHWDST